MYPVRIICLLLLATFLVACGGKSATSRGAGQGTEQVGGAGGGTSGTGGGGLQEGSRFDEGGAAGAEAVAGPTAPLKNRVVYFDFDSSDVLPEYRELIIQNGDYLVEHSDARLRLEGHTDERGSREYNIGLGERRAQAVRQLLLLQGVAADQLTTVSYGEERPAVLGSDEEAWALNRRVELVYVR